MSNVQQPRRGATRRVLKASVAMGAVLALSQVQGAYAVVSAVSTCDTPGTKLNSAPISTGGACGCVEGYTTVTATAPPTPGTAAALDCKFCAPGYYLKTAVAAGAAGVGAECVKIGVSVSATVITAGDQGDDVTAVTSATALPGSPTCAVDYYGTPQNYDGTGCVKCPAGTAATLTGGTITACLVKAGYYLSTAGTSTTAGTVKEVPAGYYATVATTPVTSANVALIWDGTDADLSGVASNTHGVLKCPTNSNSAAGSTAAGDCKVNPGYWVSDATAPTISLAPANTYAPGGQAVTGTTTPTDCPYAGTSAAGSSAQTDCTPDCSTTNADSGAEALAGTCFCSAGTYSSGTISGGQPDDASNSNAAAAASGCTKCSTTFAKADASMITSGFASTAWTECKVKAGYYITSPTGLVNGQITVAPAPAGTFQPQAVQLTGSGRKDTVLMTCPANSNSVAGSAECTCDDGYIVVSTLGGSECQATSAAAASPTADSAGASTPIAVALAAAAAVPLLL